MLILHKLFSEKIKKIKYLDKQSVWLSIKMDIIYYVQFQKKLKQILNIIIKLSIFLTILVMRVINTIHTYLLINWLKIYNFLFIDIEKIIFICAFYNLISIIHEKPYVEKSNILDKEYLLFPCTMFFSFR